MIELTKKLIKWENRFLSLSFFGYVFIKTISEDSKKLDYKVRLWFKRFFALGNLLADSKPWQHCLLRRHYRANFGEPTGASTSPRHQREDDSCITIIDLCVLLVCVPCLSVCECTKTCSWRPEMDMDRERMGSWWYTNLIDRLLHQLITEGLLGGFACSEKQAEGCLWKACLGLQLFPLFWAWAMEPTMNWN